MYVKKLNRKRYTSKKLRRSKSKSKRTTKRRRSSKKRSGGGITCWNFTRNLQSKLTELEQEVKNINYDNNVEKQTRNFYIDIDNLKNVLEILGKKIDNSCFKNIDPQLKTKTENDFLLASLKKDILIFKYTIRLNHDISYNVAFWRNSDTYDAQVNDHKIGVINGLIATKKKYPSLSEQYNNLIRKTSMLKDQTVKTEFDGEISKLRQQSRDIGEQDYKGKTEVS